MNVVTTAGATARDTCPNCEGPATQLFYVSQGIIVDYCQCARCGEVWTVPKGRIGPVQVLGVGRAPDQLNSPDPTVLKLHCDCCHGAASLQFNEWHPAEPPQRQFWWCPYCRKAHVAQFAGKLACVSKDHSEERQ